MNYYIFEMLTNCFQLYPSHKGMLNEAKLLY